MLKPTSLIAFFTGLLILALFSVETAVARESTSIRPIQVGGSMEALDDSSVTDAEIAFQLIFSELLSEIDIQFKIKIYADDELLIDKFKRGDIEAIFLSSSSFFNAEDLIHSTGRYIVQFGDSLKQRSLVLVNRNKNIERLQDLAQSKFSYNTGHLIGRRFLDVELMERDLPRSDLFFSQIKEVKDANSAIIDLYFQKVDVVVVAEDSYRLATELNPQISKSIKILIQSKPMIYQVVGMRYDFPQEIIDRFEPYILPINPSPRIQQVLSTFRITRLHRATDEILMETRELNDRYMSLENK